MPDKPLATPQGQIDPAALRERINAALSKTEEPRPVRWRLRIERVGSDIRVICPCGKSRILDRHINIFCRQFNAFIEEHSWCEPGDAA